MKLNSGAHAAQPFWMPAAASLHAPRATHSIVQGWYHSAAAAPKLSIFLHALLHIWIHLCGLCGQKKGLHRWLHAAESICAVCRFPTGFWRWNGINFLSYGCYVQSATLVPREEKCTPTLFWKGPLHFYGGIMQCALSALWHWVRKVLRCGRFTFGQKFQGRGTKVICDDSP